MTKRGLDSAGEFDKVVVHLENGVIKGYVEGRREDTLNALLRNEAGDPPALLRIRLISEDTIREIPIQSTKAIFFVKDFEGDTQRKNLRFYRGANILHGVWIRVKFTDGEIMEGMVHNTVHFLVDPGFFMRPTDPYSNNQLIYVVKRSLSDFCVLGLRDM